MSIYLNVVCVIYMHMWYAGAYIYHSRTECMAHSLSAPYSLETGYLSEFGI